MKVTYGRLREDRKKSNGDWEFDKLTRTAYADVTCKDEDEFNLLSEALEVHGFTASWCPTITPENYSDTFYFDIDEKKDFKESYAIYKKTLKERS